jgi:hypothetical protein
MTRASNPDDLAATGARDLPCPRRMQESWDKSARKGPDLVQVYRAMIRKLKAPGYPPGRQGRHPLLAAEQIGLATLDGFHGTVHLDEGVSLTWGGGMNEAGQDVLANAAFTPDQHGHAAVRTLSCREEVEDRGGAAVQCAEAPYNDS